MFINVQSTAFDHSRNLFRYQLIRPKNVPQPLFLMSHMKVGPDILGNLSVLFFGHCYIFLDKRRVEMVDMKPHHLSTH